MIALERSRSGSHKYMPKGINLLKLESDFPASFSKEVKSADVNHDNNAFSRPAIFRRKLNIQLNNLNI